MVCKWCEQEIYEAVPEGSRKVYAHSSTKSRRCEGQARGRHVATPYHLTVFEPYRIHPEQLTDILPRCSHGSCLIDGGGERLVPPCGCRACHYCSNLADEHIGERNSCPDHYADALEAASRDNATVAWVDHALGNKAREPRGYFCKFSGQYEQVPCHHATCQGDK